MAGRRHRTPPTPAQRRRMIIVGAVLVFLACFAVLYEVVVYEQEKLIALIVACVVLFCVFILPIIGTVRQVRRHRT